MYMYNKKRYWNRYAHAEKTMYRAIKSVMTVRHAQINNNNNNPYEYYFSFKYNIFYPLT